MADPLREKIRKDVKSTLQTITVANGYEQDLEVVAGQTSADAVAKRDGLCELWQDSPQDLEESSPVQKRDELLEFVVAVYAGKDGSTDVDERLNFMIADVRKAIMEDRNRNGLAINTTVRSPIQFEHESGALFGAIIPVQVHMRTVEINEYTQG